MTSSSRTAGHVIRAGAIYPMTGEDEVLRSLALADGRIVSASKDPHGLDHLISSNTVVIDDPLLTVLPGLIDTHSPDICGSQHR